MKETKGYERMDRVSGVPEITPAEFRDLGFLQEVNRQFLHPLGLALEVVICEETGEVTLGRIWDYRDALAGIIFEGDALDTPDARIKARRVAHLFHSKARERRDEMGYVVQPLLIEQEKT